MKPPYAELVETYQNKAQEARKIRHEVEEIRLRIIESKNTSNDHYEKLTDLEFELLDKGSRQRLLELNNHISSCYRQIGKFLCKHRAETPSGDGFIEQP